MYKYDFLSHRQSADPPMTKKRPNPPCGVTEGIEIVCLLVLACDFTFKVKFSACSSSYPLFL